MKNNQFKKEIRKIIEEECKTFEFTSIYNDESNNSRMIYLYTLDYKFVGMFSFYLTNKNIHLSFTNLTTLSIVQHKVKDVNVKYTEFNKVVETIKEAFDIMDRTEG